MLGLLAGATLGLAAAGVAGARRTSDVIPRYAAASGTIDAAVLPNDPSFDTEVRARVAALPEVRGAFPFMVPFFLEVRQPKGMEATLLPESRGTLDLQVGVLVDGRAPDPERADEVVVNQNVQRKYGIGIGSTMVVGQFGTAEDVAEIPPDLVPADPDPRFRARLRVVGISKATSEETDWAPSTAFYEKYRDKLGGVTNMFVQLQHGEADFARSSVASNGSPVSRPTWNAGRSCSASSRPRRSRSWRSRACCSLPSRCSSAAARSSVKRWSVR